MLDPPILYLLVFLRGEHWKAQLCQRASMRSADRARAALLGNAFALYLLPGTLSRPRLLGERSKLLCQVIPLVSDRVILNDAEYVEAVLFVKTPGLKVERV